MASNVPKYHTSFHVICTLNHDANRCGVALVRTNGTYTTLTTFSINQPFTTFSGDNMFAAGQTTLHGRWFLVCDFVIQDQAFSARYRNHGVTILGFRNRVFAFRYV